ncbi:MAG: DUF4202 family protein [Candidatus Marinimicrobia bacterium]|nr:DUF4202 family protein [Candidatus Neomarinimicrobiota bacterium]
MIAGSKVPEDPRHAENTLKWLLKLEPEADEALQIAALGHDIDRAVEARKVQRADFADYDAFKAAHALHSAVILKEIMDECGVARDITTEVYRLVCIHEIGGDPRADRLKDADAISYFDVNLPLYYARTGREETLRRCVWGYQRLSAQMRTVVENMTYEDHALNALLKQAVREAGAAVDAGNTIKHGAAAAGNIQEERNR